MGKGDKRTRKGKIFIGSHGNSRRKKQNYRPPVVAPKSDSTTATEKTTES